MDQAPNGIVIGVTLAGVAMLLALMRAAAYRPAARVLATGELILACPRFLVWTMAAVAVGGPIGMVVLSLVIQFRHPAEVYIPIVIGAFFLVAGGHSAWWALRLRTRVSETALTSEYMFTTSRELKWTDIQKLSFSNGYDFWLRGPNDQKALLHTWFVGVGEALPMLQQHLPETVRQQYKRELSMFAHAIGGSWSEA